MRESFIFHRFFAALGCLVFVLLASLCGLGSAAQAYSQEGFARWLAHTSAEARRAGIRPETLAQVMPQVDFLPKVITLDRKQPEKKSFAEYTSTVLSQKRIDEGRVQYRAHALALRRLEARTGVPGSVVVALWGIETSYGKNTGDYNIFSSLATLGYEGRRGSYFKNEFLKALRIVDEGIPASRMRGSWAGAMGQCQFMPSSYLSYAVDGDGDGHRDIWKNTNDIFPSMANYLARNGWKAREPVVEKVTHVPSLIPDDMIGTKTREPLSLWRDYGLLINARLPSHAKASLWLPYGRGGPGYLLYDNAHVLMKWNRSTYFVTSVGLLASFIEAAPAIPSQND